MRINQNICYILYVFVLFGGEYNKRIQDVTETLTHSPTHPLACARTHALNHSLLRKVPFTF